MKFQLSDMSTEEVREILKKCEIALIPVGSVEQHGPHMPLFSDSLITYEVTKLVAEKIHNEIPIVVAPLIPFGKSTEHSKFPGTITLRSETFTNLIKDVCRSLAKAGFKKLVLVNGHGGNTQLLGSIALDVAEETKTFVVVFDWWQTDILSDVKSQILESKFDLHAGEIETSMLLFLKPDLVQKEKIQRHFPIKFTEETGFKYLRVDKPHYVFGFSWFSEDLSLSGVTGDPTKAEAAKGKVFLDKLTERLCDVIRELKNKIVI